MPDGCSSLPKQTVPEIDQWIESDVTSFVSEEVNGDDIVTLAIESNSSSTVSYHAFEASPCDRPHLVIVTE